MYWSLFSIKPFGGGRGQGEVHSLEKHFELKVALWLQLTSTWRKGQIHLEAVLPDSETLRFSLLPAPAGIPTDKGLFTVSDSCSCTVVYVLGVPWAMSTSAVDAGYSLCYSLETGHSSHWSRSRCPVPTPSPIHPSPLLFP